MADTPRLARASAWMALGTVVSRATGLLRSVLLIAVIGTALNADLFNTANSIPNSLYILVAGGVFNVVLVPQLVRAMRNDPDGGDAYAHRIITLGMLVLLGATILLMLAVPLIMRIIYADLFTPEFTAQRQSAYLLMILCLPQVFFYGAFVLVGQILNARERFGPMMWAPIVNNLTALVVLGIYAVVFGADRDGTGGFSTAESLLLGIGSTLGIIIQAAVLVPFLGRVGFRYRPRFDFRGVGLGHTLRLGAWTLGFIIVNQIAFFVIARLGVRATSEGRARDVPAAGTTVYDFGFLLAQVPHGIITVSVATAIIPTLSAYAAAGRVNRVGIEIGRTLRLVMSLVVPIAVAVGVLGPQLARLLPGENPAIGMTISAFALGMVAFTIHYVVLRGFYAMEDTRTPFWIQLVIMSVNLGTAVVATRMVEPIWVATVLAVCWSLSYVIGLAIAFALLSRRVQGALVDHEMMWFLLKMALLTLMMCGVMVATSLLWVLFEPTAGGALTALTQLIVVGGVGAVTYLFMAEVLGMNELRYVLTSLMGSRGRR
ncbi:murein biosynthesis integral membrane protein MurJ [Aeromicrobium sp. PE09-221]|uniref:murein biosynthesis integral membrane protein MurJ n=1 Tax=Aeromicrobium sp. PE09-221 TaxID=1898043 RepID=UPI000B3E4F99|nr:murein biosynthesis integral membrane protein MurJ [Aeromicrobium sp. PE09-221]OUZ12561.1 murein biosynthesis integral membrane protein MurJ [Aeromicrobium sp. PE09-221]